eukprot:7624029-Pyramimonas_sp.AAC.1
MRALLPGLSVEPPTGPRTAVRGVCRASGARGPCHWGLRWRSLWGHGTREGCAEIGRGRHENLATEAFGGALMEPRSV